MVIKCTSIIESITEKTLALRDIKNTYTTGKVFFFFTTGKLKQTNDMT